jgi:hypothetical protein
VRYDGTEGDAERQDNEEIETNATETTPLIQQRRRLHWSSPKNQEEDGEQGGGAIGWWILQLLIVVPVPAVLMSHIWLLMMDGVSQTLSDGSNPIIGNISLLASCF